MSNITPDTLFTLLREAHKEYQENVPSNKMTLRIFALQFIAGHKHGSSESISDKNRHSEALSMVKILLTERHDLVALFFDAPLLSDDDIEKMMEFVYTESRIDANGEVVQHNPLKCTLCDEDWPVVMECVNKTHLFKKEVSEDEIKSLMLGTLKSPLVAGNLKGICRLFDALSIGEFITGQWQTPLAESGSIVSARTEKSVTASNLSSTLSRLKEKAPQPFETDIKLLMSHLSDRTAPKSQ